MYDRRQNFYTGNGDWRPTDVFSILMRLSHPWGLAQEWSLLERAFWWGVNLTVSDLLHMWHTIQFYGFICINVTKRITPVSLVKLMSVFLCVCWFALFYVPRVCTNSVALSTDIYRSKFVMTHSMRCLLLSGELLAERCRTDDLIPSISLLCLPGPSAMPCGLRNSVTVLWGVRTSNPTFTRMQRMNNRSGYMKAS